jgi:hypothetical protein
MAAAKTKNFQLTIRIDADPTADNQEIDLSDYIDIADNEAFELQDWDVMLDPNSGSLTDLFPTDNSTCVFQLADSNLASFVSDNQRTSLGVARISYNATNLTTDKNVSMSHDNDFYENLVVSKTLWVRNESTTGTLTHTMTLRGRIVKPSAKDYMALILTQTGQVAA